MRKGLPMIVLSLLLIIVPALMVFGQTGVTEEKYSLWVGGHYTDLTDYAKKVGEYNLDKDEFVPELKFDYYMRGNGQIFSLYGHYYDEKNARGELSTIVGDRFKADIRYRSMLHRKGQDLLTNLETREAGGGKILTHEILDPRADYNVHRKEIQTDVEILLAREHNLKLIAAHRTILQTGTEQKIGATHCFSCHVTSQSATVDKVSHQIIAALQGEIGRNTVGYEFGYRIFESKAPEVGAYFDPAVHPVTGASGAEFSSRMIYSDTILPIGTYPKTEKMSHKVRIKGDLGKGKYAGSLSYSEATNRKTDLSSTAWVGSFNYAWPLNQKTRLIARVTGTRLRADDPFIDLPLFRAGRGGPQIDFSFTRWSSLDRADARGSLELISRLTKKTTASVMLEYDRIDRYDYPEADGLTTNRFIGQVKMQYRKGLKYATTVKYRFEKTSDPFVSGRGLFERPGRDELEQLVPGFAFIFYFQREDLRYQTITSLPTDEHIFEWSSTWRPDKKINLTVGLKGKYDKNGDLDSLDVNHLSLQPNLAVNLIPSPKWAVTLGGTHAYFKSRGPVTVALFDG
nr:hypothetical protein [candidate division Zixibacteria bacterium]